ncbi:MAG: 1-phosphofructokinase family hexose kinase [Acidimicrobiia bacterium]
MGHPQHTVAIFAPIISLTVTVESPKDNGSDEIHFHPGGQGFWVARMLRHLGERPLICGPIGGESGKVIRGLLPQWGIDLSPIEIEGSSPVTIHDRRSGERESIADASPPPLDRHSADEFYGAFLERAISAGMAVVAGQVGGVLQNAAYRRLGHDLASTDVKVVGDLHGDELSAFLQGGPIDILKVSDDDLKADGWLKDDTDDARFAALGDLIAAGARSVVLSRGGNPVLALMDDRFYEARPPELEAADYRGTGDSMTAGLAASLRTGLGPTDALKLACGAGAANVTRHGLGSASDTLFKRLADQVEVRSISPTPV